MNRIKSYLPLLFLLFIISQFVLWSYLLQSTPDTNTTLQREDVHPQNFHDVKEVDNNIDKIIQQLQNSNNNNNNRQNIGNTNSPLKNGEQNKFSDFKEPLKNGLGAAVHNSKIQEELNNLNIQNYDEMRNNNNRLKDENGKFFELITENKLTTEEEIEWFGNVDQKQQQQQQQRQYDDEEQEDEEQIIQEVEKEEITKGRKLPQEGARELGYVAQEGGQEWKQKEGDQKLQVFLIPHTHCDAGWLKTFDEYYDTEVRSILDTVTDALTKNPKRKFAWVEIGFLDKWWKYQVPEKRKAFKDLVEKQQIEIVMGGWVSSDEATVTYTNLINQMTEGHRFIQENINQNVYPTVGWQIDPFGLSRVTPAVFQAMKFDSHVAWRISEPTMKNYMENQTLEFIWRSDGPSSDIFMHLLPWSYASPDEFLFRKRDYGAVSMYASKLVSSFKSRAAYYDSPKLMWLWGHDFQFQDAHVMFDMMDEVINHINSSPDYNVTVNYATPREYFASAKTVSKKYDIRDGDYFPYWAGPVNWWTGYFTSRPLLKLACRELDHLQRSVEAIFSLARLYSKDRLTQSQWLELFNLLEEVRKVQGIMQHHDAITGTMREHVNTDYVNMMTKSRSSLLQVLSTTFPLILDTSCVDHLYLTVDHSIHEANQTSSRSHIIDVDINIANDNDDDEGDGGDEENDVDVRMMITHNDVENGGNDDDGYEKNEHEIVNEENESEGKIEGNNNNDDDDDKEGEEDENQILEQKIYSKLQNLKEEERKEYDDNEYLHRFSKQKKRSVNIDNDNDNNNDDDDGNDNDKKKSNTKRTIEDDDLQVKFEWNENDTEGEIVLFNSLAWDRSEVLSIPITTPDIQLWDSYGNSMETSILFERNTASEISGFLLYFQAKVPAFGFSRYRFKVDAESPRSFDQHTEIVYYPSTIRDEIEDLLNATYSVLDVSTTISINNQLIQLDFSPRAEIKSLTILSGPDQRTIDLTQSYYVYNGDADWDNHYTFKPTGPPKEISPNSSDLHIVIIKTPLVTEVCRILPSAHITQSWRIYAHSFIVDVEDVIGPPTPNTSIVSRFQTSLSTLTNDGNPEFFTDDNGLDTIQRIYNLTLPIEGNYYPMVYSSFLRQSTSLQFSYLSSLSRGVTSATSGSLEVMLHRSSPQRLANGEPLVDKNIVAMRSQLIFTEKENTLRPMYSHLLNFPLLPIFISRSKCSHYTVQSFVSAPLPPTMHLTTFQSFNSSLDLISARVNLLSSLEGGSKVNNQVANPLINFEHRNIFTYPFKSVVPRSLSFNSSPLPLPLHFISHFLSADDVI